MDTSLDRKEVATLTDFVAQKRVNEFPVAESFDVGFVLRGYRKSNSSYGEYSRIIDHPDYRGFGLSKIAILTAIADSKLRNHPRMIFGACVPQHAKMYEKYGWRFVEGIDLVLEEKVQQVARAMVSDVFSDVPEAYDSTINSVILPQLQESQKVLYPFP